MMMISFGMFLSLMSWVQQVHNAAVVARSLGCRCDTEIPTGRTLTETLECGNPGPGPLNPARQNHWNKGVKREKEVS